MIGKAVFGSKPFTERTDYEEPASTGVRSFSERAEPKFEKKTFEKKPYAKKTFGDKPAYAKKSFGDKPAYGKKSFEDRPFAAGKKTWEKKAFTPFGKPKASSEAPFPAPTGGSAYPRKRDYKSGSAGKYGAKDSSYKK